MYIAAIEKEKKKKRKENQKKRHDDVICSRKEGHVKILGTNLFGFFAASCFGRYKLKNV